jgi:23S rRNA (guanosine2251-2'-O)-methyltransferase
MRKLRIEELNRIDAEAFKKADKVPVIVVLDNVRSLNNIGSLFRTCDAFRVEKIFLCGITATPPHKDIHKTALGATESVEWEYHQESIHVIKKLRNEGCRILSVEQAEGSTDLQDLRINSEEKIVLVFGHEVKGVNQQIIDLSHECIEIPQYGTKHSLNISVSAGIVIWEVFRKIGKHYL